MTIKATNKNKTALDKHFIFAVKTEKEFEMIPLGTKYKDLCNKIL